MTNNKDEEADDVLSQLKLFNEINKERSTFRHRFCRIWKSLKLRSALGHFGLMVSLSIYCVVGGVVSIPSNSYKYVKLALLKRFFFSFFRSSSFHFLTPKAISLCFVFLLSIYYYDFYDLRLLCHLV